jgi:type IV pilus assembly protein PilM
MPRAVGLDIGRRLLKLAVVSGSAKSFKVQRFVVEELPDGTGEEADAARTETVRRVLAENKVLKDDICLAFDAGTAVFRDVSVPFQEDDQIAKVVRFEAENHLHGRAIEDVVVNWVKTGSTKEGSQVLVMAAPKAEIAQRLASLRQAGVEPASVDLDATALFTACHAAGVFTESPNTVVLEIGARTTNLLLIDGGELRAIRSFLVGSDSVTTALATDLALPAGEASRRARSGGDDDALLVPLVDDGTGALAGAARETGKSVAELEQDVATQRREDFVKKLQREVMRSITSSRATNAPEKVLVAGGGSLLPGLAERLGMPVERLGLLSRLGGAATGGADPALADAVSPVAIGCALRLVGADPLGVELRREEFAPTNTFEVIRGVLATAVTLLVVVLGGMTWLARDRLDRERGLFIGRSSSSIASKAKGIFDSVEKAYQVGLKGKDETAAIKEAKRLYDQIPIDPNFLNSIRNHLQRRYRELEEGLGLSKDIPTIESALKGWVELYAALESIPREKLGWFRVNKMSVSQTTASLTIEFQDLGVVDLVVEALKASKYLVDRAKDRSRPVVAGNTQTNTQSGRSTVTIEVPFEDVTR